MRRTQSVCLPLVRCQVLGARCQTASGNRLMPRGRHRVRCPRDGAPRTKRQVPGAELQIGESQVPIARCRTADDMTLATVPGGRKLVPGAGCHTPGAKPQAPAAKASNNCQFRFEICDARVDSARRPIAKGVTLRSHSPPAHKN